MLVKRPIGTFLATLTAGVLAASVSFAYSEHDESSANRAEIGAVLSAKMGPVEAIRAAEAKTGGRAVEFSLENRDTSFVYEVHVMTGAGLEKIAVDPATGAAASVPERMDADGSQAKPSPTTLAAAVTAAERQSGGRALEAFASVTNGQPVFVVTTAKTPDSVTNVTVAGADGRVLGMAKAGGESGGEGSGSDVD